MTPRLVGVSGPAGVGKGEVARVLNQFGWRTVKMAGPLKGMLEYLIAQRGFTPEENREMLEGVNKEEPCFYGQSPRHLMQTLGTDWGRDLVAEDFWVKMAQETIADALADGYSVVVDDIRFQNEVDMIRRLGGVVIRVYRADRTRNPGDHKSEGSPITPDALVYNNGTAAEFHDKIARMFT